jgi:PKD domain
MKMTRIAGALVLALGVTWAGSLAAQENPLAIRQPKGMAVSPNFEGWYQNPDGTYTLSFGYVNLNTEEILSIPVGEHNKVEPGNVDQGQPTYFLPWRQFGVFTVTVPADFGDKRVTWTLEANGQRYAIPGGLFKAYETDNLHSRGTDQYPPILVLREGGVESRGPNGATVGPLSVKAGQPLALSVKAWDRQGKGVTLRWYKYRGAGDVTFADGTLPIGEGAQMAATTATFSAPGDYVLYVRADHTGQEVADAGMEECCWTNGYVKVKVTK